MFFEVCFSSIFRKTVVFGLELLLVDFHCISCRFGSELVCICFVVVFARPSITGYQQSASQLPPRIDLDIIIKIIQNLIYWFLAHRT